MPRPAQRAYSRTSIEVGRLLGRLIRLSRRQKRMAARDLAERVGMSRATLQRIEKGDLKVEAGLYFEAAAVLGLQLFSRDEAEIATLRRGVEDKLTLLPQAPRQPRREIDDDF